MLSFELSVPPHYKEVQYVTDSFFRTKPNSPPPHVILKKSFLKVDEAIAFLSYLDFKTDSNVLEDVVRAASTEWVDAEIEVLEVTGQQYTIAVIHVEGQFTP
jgi:hypothetical protein